MQSTVSIHVGGQYSIKQTVYSRLLDIMLSFRVGGVHETQPSDLKTFKLVKGI